MIAAYREAINRAKSQKKRYRKLFLRLKSESSKVLDDSFHKLHEDAFEQIDCLSCANCCKTTSHIFYDRDIERLSKHLNMKAVDFVEKYLKIDEDGDQVLKSSPCPFLMDDNCCSVYEHRPKACREYPHTNRKRMHQILDITLQNTRVCPAVARIVEQLDQKVS